jgi:aspartokinase-like uncharacterized kinase
MNALTAFLPSLTVVKLGGSYARSPRFAEAVGAIASAREAVAIVPGGGPFADTVREMQAPMGYDDHAAHRMAILAMCQFAEMMPALSPRLRIANSLGAIRGAVAEGFHAVWSPWPLADGLEAVPPSWDITSDSLAAWLAGRLKARRLVLLKSTNPPACEMTPHEAAALSVVDSQFPAFLREVGEGVQVWWFGPEQLGQLPAFLDDEAEAGARLICEESVDICSPPTTPHALPGRSLDQGISYLNAWN